MLNIKNKIQTGLHSLYHRDPRKTNWNPILLREHKTENWKREAWIKFRLDCDEKGNRNETLKLMRKRLKLGNSTQSNRPRSPTPTMLMTCIANNLFVAFFWCKEHCGL